MGVLREGERRAVLELSEWETLVEKILGFICLRGRERGEEGGIEDGWVDCGVGGITGGWSLPIHHPTVQLH